MIWDGLQEILLKETYFHSQFVIKTTIDWIFLLSNNKIAKYSEGRT